MSGGRSAAGDRGLLLHSWDATERVLDSGGFESTPRVLASGPVVECSESGARWLGIAYWQAVNRRCGEAGVRAMTRPRFRA